MSKANRKLVLVADQVSEAYKNGMTLREIATLHSVATGTVRNTLIESGIELRSRGRRRNEGTV